jgi:hypothetical protein
MRTAQAGLVPGFAHHLHLSMSIVSGLAPGWSDLGIAADPGRLRLSKPVQGQAVGAL